MSKVLYVSLCAAMIVVASSADARRLGAGRSIPAKPAEVKATEASATTTISFTRPQAVAVGTAAKVETPMGRAMTAADTKAAVITGVVAGTTSAAIRNANAEAASDPSSDANGARAGGTAPGYQSVAYQRPSSDPTKPSRDPDLDRERAAEALAVRLFDQSARQAAELMEKPRTAAEIAREKKEAELKAAAKRAEDERKMKLAREQSCRIEPVMTDKAIANCRKVFREAS